MTQSSASENNEYHDFPTAVIKIPNELYDKEELEEYQIISVDLGTTLVLHRGDFSSITRQLEVTEIFEPKINLPDLLFNKFVAKTTLRLESLHDMKNYVAEQVQIPNSVARKWLDEVKVWQSKSVGEWNYKELQQLFDLYNSKPSSIEEVLKSQKLEISALGRVRQKSPPFFVPKRKWIERGEIRESGYTGYDLTLEDLKNSCLYIEACNVPVEPFGDGDVIVITGKIVAKAPERKKRKRMFKALDAMSVKVIERNESSDPLEHIRTKVLEAYKSQNPQELSFSDVLRDLCDRDVEISKILDPKGSRIFSISETVPKRLNKLCCERRSQDDGYLERSVKVTPLRYRWKAKSI